MKILVADDDPITLQILDSLLRSSGYDVITATDGESAWQILRGNDGPQLAILDWIMPGMDGAKICSKVRESDSNTTYLILLTVRNSKGDIVTGLEAGANDYIPKPFDHDELRARVQVGTRMVRLQSELTARVRELQEATTKIKILSGMLPICSVCKKIRDEKGAWKQIETYIREHSEAEFTHSYCPECAQKLYPDFYKKN